MSLGQGPKYHSLLKCRFSSFLLMFVKLQSIGFMACQVDYKHGDLNTSRFCSLLWSNRFSLCFRIQLILEAKMSSSCPQGLAFAHLKLSLSLGDYL